MNTSRKRKYDLRDVVDSILYLLRTGCQWRNLPDNFPPWQTVYRYFKLWKEDIVFEEMNELMNKRDRQRDNREAYPSVMCIDSQSVKLSPMIYEDRGIDPNKKVNGRKRQIMVDTGGRIWHVHVHAAGIADGYGGLGLSDDIFDRKKRLKKVFGDQAYNGVFADRMEAMGLTYQKASKPESTKGFVPVKGRWVVERSIAWTNFFRRLTKDYERTTSSSEAFLLLANIQLMLQRNST